MIDNHSPHLASSHPDRLLVGQIAERHPGLSLMIDHLGHVLGGKDDAAFSNNAELCGLAKHPNIAVKATGAPGYST